MSEYIERAYLLSALAEGDVCKLCYSETSADCKRKCLQKELISFVKDCDNADVAPVRHGRWSFVDASPEYELRDGERVIVDHTLEEKCSLCHVRAFRYETEQKWNYCPNCGARMDGET